MTATKAAAKKAAPKHEHKAEGEVKVEALVELGSCPNQMCPLHLNVATVDEREAAMTPQEPVAPDA